MLAAHYEDSKHRHCDGAGTVRRRAAHQGKRSHPGRRMEVFRVIRWARFMVPLLFASWNVGSVGAFSDSTLGKVRTSGCRPVSAGSNSVAAPVLLSQPGTQGYGAARHK